MVLLQVSDGAGTIQANAFTCSPFSGVEAVVFVVVLLETVGVGCGELVEDGCVVAVRFLDSVHENIPIHVNVPMEKCRLKDGNGLGGNLYDMIDIPVPLQVVDIDGPHI